MRKYFVHHSHTRPSKDILHWVTFPTCQNLKTTSFSLKAQALCRMSLRESMSVKGEGQKKNNGENSTGLIT